MFFMTDSLSVGERKRRRGNWSSIRGKRFDDKRMDFELESNDKQSSGSVER